MDTLTAVPPSFRLAAGWLARAAGAPLRAAGVGAALPRASGVVADAVHDAIYLLSAFVWVATTMFGFVLLLACICVVYPCVITLWTAAMCAVFVATSAWFIAVAGRGPLALGAAWLACRAAARALAARPPLPAAAAAAPAAAPAAAKAAAARPAQPAAPPPATRAPSAAAPPPPAPAVGGAVSCLDVTGVATAPAAAPIAADAGGCVLPPPAPSPTPSAAASDGGYEVVGSAAP